MRQSKEPSCSVSIKRAVCPIQRALHPISLCSFELQVSFSNYRSLFQITGLFCKSRLSYTKSPTSYITVYVCVCVCVWCVFCMSLKSYVSVCLCMGNYRSLLQKSPKIYDVGLFVCVCVSSYITLHSIKRAVCPMKRGHIVCVCVCVGDMWVCVHRDVAQCCSVLLQCVAVTCIYTVRLFLNIYANIGWLRLVGSLKW